MQGSITYKKSGVDIDLVKESLDRIKIKIGSTFDSNVLKDIGAFGGFYQLDLVDMDQPVLVSSIDGIGTKLKIAFSSNKHDTIGEDLVNHCINDITACGAKPLYFMDYLATSKFKPDVFEQIINGFVNACKKSRCALIGGETAEMTGFYADGEYDISGVIVGIVDKSKIIDGRTIKTGDVLIGLPSSGLHTNGFSLARRVLLDHFKIGDIVDELGMTLSEELLKIHRCYLDPIQSLIKNFQIKGISHITGGGIVGNTMRILPEKLSLNINWKNWKRPFIFELIKRIGNVPESEMRKTFNLGVGMIAIVSEANTESVLAHLYGIGEKSFIVGNVEGEN